MKVERYHPDLDAYVHWHVSPVPPGVPLEEQQYAALSWNKGVLKLTPDDMANLARRLSNRINVD